MIKIARKKKNMHGRFFRKIDRKSCFFASDDFFGGIYEFYGQNYIHMEILVKKYIVWPKLWEFLPKIWVLLGKTARKKKIYAWPIFSWNRPEIVFFRVGWFFRGYIWILWPKVHTYGNFGEKIHCLTPVMGGVCLKYGYCWVRPTGTKNMLGRFFHEIDQKSCFSRWVVFSRVYMNSMTKKTYIWKFWWKNTLSNPIKFGHITLKFNAISWNETPPPYLIFTYFGSSPPSCEG